MSSHINKVYPLSANLVLRLLLIALSNIILIVDVYLVLIGVEWCCWLCLLLHETHMWNESYVEVPHLGARFFHLICSWQITKFKNFPNNFQSKYNNLTGLGGCKLGESYTRVGFLPPNLNPRERGLCTTRFAILHNLHDIEWSQSQKMLNTHLDLAHGKNCESDQED